MSAFESKWQERDRRRAEREAEREAERRRQWEAEEPLRAARAALADEIGEDAVTALEAWLDERSRHA